MIWINVIVIIETKLTEDKVAELDLAIPGYASPFRRDRSAHGGGIIVWVKTELAAGLLDDAEFSDTPLEVLWFTVKQNNGRNIVFCAAYRPPSSTDVSMMDYFDRTLPRASTYGESVVLLGDFNLHSAEWLGSSKTTTAGTYAEGVFASHGLAQLVHVPTRGENTLDLILTDIAPTRVRVSTGAPLGKSDHIVILADIAAGLLREPRTVRKVWQYSKADWGRLRHFLSREAEWDKHFNAHDDPAELLAALETELRMGLGRFIPSRELKTRTCDPSWWTPACTQATRKKQRAHRQLRRNETARAKAAYQTATRRAAKILHTACKAERRRVRRKLRRGQMKDREWWRTLKRAGGLGRSGDIPMLALPDGKEATTSKDKAHAFGEFFASKCTLGGKDFKDGVLPHVRPRSTRKLAKIHFRASEVERLLRNLDTTKASGPDGFSTRVLKECAEELAPIFARLFSKLFRLGVMPPSWKLANVVPVHKKKSKANVKNYRPVSLLSVASKVMESVVNRQLMNFLESSRTLSRNQFGFRRFLGTSDLLTALHNEWIQVLNNGGCVRLLAVDIAGAFDRVSHRGLLHKLEAYGVHGPLLNWLRSYLTGRTIRAVVNGHGSQTLPITAGVPQGSVLGPTLFLLYVNDLEDHLPDGVELAVYADDTTMYTFLRTKDSCEDDCAALQAAVDVLSRWGKEWWISFEPSKSYAMTIGRKRADWTFPPIMFDGCAVPEVDEIKLLGLIIDSQLSHAGQARALANSAKKRIGFLRRAGKVLCGEGRLNVYKAFVRPRLEYAPLVWMGAAACHLEQLDEVQELAARIIGPSASSLDSLDHRRRVGALTYLYKLQSWEAPERLTRMIPERQPRPPPGRTRLARQAHDTWHPHKFSSKLPLRSLDRACRAFPFGVLREWNSLPEVVFQKGFDLSLLQDFKCNVNRHLHVPT